MPQLTAIQHPISVKGIVIDDGRVWLRKNERNEWELPGGRLEPKEQPHQTVARELHEELGFITTVGELIATHMYRPTTIGEEAPGVLVVIYECRLERKTGSFELVSEAGLASFELHTLSAMRLLPMPEFYKIAIEKVMMT